MVKIKKGNQVRIVPKSVYEGSYKQLGWKCKDIKQPESTEEANIVESVEEAADAIDFSSMSTSELKQYAADNQIDISEASNKKQLIAILESAVGI